MVVSRRSPTGRRIALVTQGFLTGGGVPAVARWLHAGLTSAGHDVVVHDLAMSSRDPTSRRLVAPTTWWRRSLSAPLDGSTTDRHWGANAVEFEPMRYRPRAELTRTLREFDVVQVVAGGPALANVAVSADVPVALQAATRVRWERSSQLAAGAGPSKAWRSAMTRLVDVAERRALRSVAAVLVWNDAMQESVRPYARGLVRLAAPGVDTARFSPHPDGWQSDGPLVSVCRLGDARKGLDRLIRAYATIAETHPSVPDLVLAGRGRLLAAEVRMIEELGVASRVQVREDVPLDQLPDLYRSASVFLQASYEEGFGVSALEAMSSGVPVVATATAGSRVLVVDGGTGWLVPLEPSDAVPAGIAESALRVLHGSGAEMARQARARALSAFSSAVSLARFTDVYDELGG